MKLRPSYALLGASLLACGVLSARAAPVELGDAAEAGRALPALPATAVPLAGASLAPALTSPLSAPSVNDPAPPSAPPAAAPAPAEEEGPTGRPNARSPQRAQHALGVLADPAAALDGRTFSLDQWNFLSFAVPADAGEPTISGAPAAESKLEFKRVQRTGPDGRSWSSYSWLALGATPAGAYEVSFPGFSFEIEVVQTDHSTREERLASARKAIGEAFKSGLSGLNEDDSGDLKFGADVPPQVRNFLPSHLRLIGREMDAYRGYVERDEFLTERERGRRLSKLGELERFHAGAVSGERAYGGLAPLLAQLLVREEPIQRGYREYTKEDPSIGRAATEAFLGQQEAHRSMMQGAYPLFAEAESKPEPGPIARLAGRIAARAAGLLMKLRLRRAVKGALAAATEPYGAGAPSPRAVGKRPLKFSPDVSPEARAFLSGAHERLSAIAPALTRYLVSDASLDEAARTEELKALGEMQDFLADRAAGTGFRWTVPALAYRMNAAGAVELAADFARYAQSDSSLTRTERRKRTREAAELASFIVKSVPR